MEAVLQVDRELSKSAAVQVRHKVDCEFILWYVSTTRCPPSECVCVQDSQRCLLVSRNVCPDCNVKLCTVCESIHIPEQLCRGPPQLCMEKSDNCDVAVHSRCILIFRTHRLPGTFNSLLTTAMGLSTPSTIW